MGVQFTTRTCAAIIVVGFLGPVVCATASAQDIPGYPSNFDAYDPREMAMLPAFCMHTMLIREKVQGGNDSAKVEMWRATLGETFNHLHHYCWGLIKTNRGVLLARTPETKASYLNYANQEFDYVIERSPPTFVLLPEIVTKRGENLVRLKKGPLGVLDFERAAELKPDYWPPYAQLSDYYSSIDDISSAREALTRGLSHAPDAAPLKRRLAELETQKKPPKAKR